MSDRRFEVFRMTHKEPTKAADHILELEAQVEALTKDRDEWREAARLWKDDALRDAHHTGLSEMARLAVVKRWTDMMRFDEIPEEVLAALEGSGDGD